MRLPASPYRLAAAAFLLVLCWLVAGCSARQDAPLPADQAGQAAPASEPLPRLQVSPGQSVHVSVSGGEPHLNADLESMLTAYLQSERGLTPAETGQKADLLVRVRIESVSPLGSKNAPVSAGKALGSAATGAMLGALLGNAVDVNGRSGAGWGAGGGALLGLGVAMLDNAGKSKIWGMRAQVGLGSRGREPAEADMRRVDRKSVV